MVGTAGSSGQRLSPQIAKARNVPALMWGKAAPSEPTLNSTVPVRSAWTASPPPLKTTSASFGNFSRILNSSSSSCGVVPIGGVAQLYFSGLARASATRSFTLLAGDSTLTTNAFGVCCKLADGDEILVWIVGQLVVEAVIDRKGIGGEQDCVTIRI